MWSVIAQAGDASSDLWEAMRSHGAAAPLVAALALWLRLALSERDRERDRAEVLVDRLLDQQAEVVALSQQVTRMASKLERRLE